MRRKLESALIGLTVSACVTLAEIKPPATPVKVYKEPAELIGSDKLVTLREHYRGRSADLFQGAEIALNDVLVAAANSKKQAVYVDFTGRRQESWGGGQALYDVVEASSVELVEPTVENIAESLAGFEGRHFVEAQSAMHLISALHMKDVNPSMLEYIKAPGSEEYVPEVVAVYAEVNGSEAHDELTKVLLFHALEGARIASGACLIRLGDREVVANALKEEKSEKVQQALKQELL